MEQAIVFRRVCCFAVLTSSGASSTYCAKWPASQTGFDARLTDAQGVLYCAVGSDADFLSGIRFLPRPVGYMISWIELCLCSRLSSPSRVRFLPVAPVGSLEIGGTTGLFGSAAVVLRAGRNYDEGEEFLVSYGPKGAAGYLEENGCAPVVVPSASVMFRQ